MRPPPPRNSQPRHASSLASELAEGSGVLRTKSKKRKSISEDPDVESAARNAYVGAQASRKILRIGQELADEAEADENEKKQLAEGGAWGMNSRGRDFGDPGAEVEDEDDRTSEPRFEDEENWGDEEDMEEEVSLEPLLKPSSTSVDNCGAGTDMHRRLILVTLNSSIVSCLPPERPRC